MQPRDRRQALAHLEAMVTAKKKTTTTRSRAKTKTAAASRRRKTAAPKAAAPRKPTAARIAERISSLTVVEAVKSDLAKLAERDLELATSGMAANALQLAREMDSKNSATSKSMCARALNETMEKIHSLAPPPQEADAVDELAARRTSRRAKAVAS